jgi:hypothetical protein
LGYLIDELVKGDVPLALQRLRSGLLTFRDPHRINQYETGLGLASGVTDRKSASLMDRTPRPFICS